MACRWGDSPVMLTSDAKIVIHGEPYINLYIHILLFSDK